MAETKRNPRWGGYKPTIAKDINKHKVQRLQRYAQELEKEANDMQTDNVVDVGVRQTMHRIAAELTEILSAKG